MRNLWFIILLLSVTVTALAQNNQSRIVDQITVGGVDCPVGYVGKQPTFAGLDQINARLPRTLIGKGEVDVMVSFSGRVAFLGDNGFRPINVVKLKFK
jgi:uncharacterized protein (TIGR03437 family)